MKRRIAVILTLVLSLPAALRGQEQACVKCSDGSCRDAAPVFDVKPRPAADVRVPVLDACKVPTDTPTDWTHVEACMRALAEQPLIPGVIAGLQIDGKPMRILARGPGYANDSVATLGSVSKPLVYVGLVKLIQDHYASPACTPMTANCVFPQKFDTPLEKALEVLDRLRGTRVLPDWYMRFAGDGEQRTWKTAMTIRHIAQMTSGFPEVQLTGYRFCPGGVCQPAEAGDETCNPDAEGPCRDAYLYNQYLNRRGGQTVIPAACRPRPGTGPRLFDFCNYYGGAVDAPGRLSRGFERRYSFEPGLLGECVLLDDANGQRWVDGRTATESEIAKFFLGMPLISEPGTEYHYSQPNLYVAAFLIEAVSRMRFDDYLKAQIFDPLGMTDTSFVIRAGTSQFQRLLDIKRQPATPARVLPDLAPPLQLDAIFGADKNWDEPRRGWKNRWPEGGGYSTAADLLRFLRFTRTGKAPDGRVLLNAESLGLVTRERAAVGNRTYAFRSPSPGVLAGNSYFAPMLRRDINRCSSMVVLLQTVTESPESITGNVRRGDYQYEDVLGLRGQLEHLIASMTNACDPPSPLDP